MEKGTQAMLTLLDAAKKAGYDGCLISTDVNLNENEIIRIYGKR